MEIKFKEIVDSDFEFIKEIYDYYIINTTATYYIERISISELKEFIYTGLYCPLISASKI